MLRRSNTLFVAKQHLDVWRALLRGRKCCGRATWSQYGEDQFIAAELQAYLQTGFYLDIGANHPTKLSNTFKLYCLGMRGIVVEPNEALCRLHQRYRPEDIQVCAGAGEADGLSTFYDFDYHGFSTFSESEVRSRAVQEHRVVKAGAKPVFRVSTILRDCIPRGRGVFCLLSVDTEGWDQQVLRGNDWDLFKPLLVAVEQNSPDDRGKASDFLLKRGYSCVLTSPCNGIYRLMKWADTSPTCIRKRLRDSDSSGEDRPANQ
jgi:FkbM family methyltransferase